MRVWFKVFDRILEDLLQKESATTRERSALIQRRAISLPVVSNILTNYERYRCVCSNNYYNI